MQNNVGSTARADRFTTSFTEPGIPFSVYLLGLSLFSMGSAEFLMGGILPQIAGDLAISLPAAGGLISAFAIGALIGAPPLAVMTLHWPKGITLFVSQAVFVAATLLSLLAVGYWPILLARFVMGLAYACFWAAAATTAVRLVQPDRRAKALSVVVSGLTIAMILGGPAGTFISELTGWRGGFWAVAAATAGAALAMLVALPKTVDQGVARPDLRTELRAMKSTALWLAYATTAATTAAYMATFGYLGALLIEVSRLPVEWLPALLALFGAGAFVGLSIGGRTADQHSFATLAIGTVGVTVTSVAISLLSSNLAVMVLLIFSLGVFGFLLNPSVWGRVYVLAPDAPTLAGATNSSAFQLGLTLAPLLAGLPISFGYGVSSIGWVGAVIGIVALGLAYLDRKLGAA